MSVLTDNLDPPFGSIGANRPDLVKIKRRLSFEIFDRFEFYLLN